MKYISTRGQVPEIDFDDVLLTGLAGDGGLYVPTDWPVLSDAELSQIGTATYAQIAAIIFSKFTGGAFSQQDILVVARDVYDAFDHRDVAPVTAFSDTQYLLELYHGPTLAFKDFAMQLLGRLFDPVLEKRNQSLTIVAATSGDTGSAAIDALRHSRLIKTVVLHPKGRVTDVQRRMMTTVKSDNILNIAVEADFDQCQAFVKAMFADREFAERISLGAVNSINWGRIAAQTVYYFSAYEKVAQGGEDVSFIVPTGNFGDIFAGFVAKKMGLPIDKLVIATNKNDILARTLETGDYRSGDVEPTISPSMDIQVASNFERLVFEATGRNSKRVRSLMNDFADRQSFSLSTSEMDFIRQSFCAVCVSENETLATMNQVYEDYKLQIDPHTAIGVAAEIVARKRGDFVGKSVVLSTAHPAKFPDAAVKATKIQPELPDRYKTLFDDPEFLTVLPADLGTLMSAIDRFVEGAR